MTFYLIGLGLDVRSISLEALETIKNCQEIYLENYTTDFPYHIKEIEGIINKTIKPLNREDVESEKLIEQSKDRDIALLVYGNPLAATTHIQLIIKARKEKINYKVIHAESILTSISETGLQLYKFGKTASMPKFEENYKPDSFLDIILQNEKIKAHTLLLTDISLSCKKALKQLQETCKKRNVSIDKLIICSRIGTKDSKIYYDTPEQLSKQEIKFPFCIIIPSELHFIEKEALEILAQ
ncbi:MAG: diphthine synthase [Candidatus Nanoarchaeia archaeon]